MSLHTIPVVFLRHPGNIKCFDPKISAGRGGKHPVVALKAALSLSYRNYCRTLFQFCGMSQTFAWFSRTWVSAQHPTPLYGPVSLHSAIVKLLGAIINKKLDYHLNTNNLLNDKQYIYRSILSTADVRTIISHRISDVSVLYPPMKIEIL